MQSWKEIVLHGNACFDQGRWYDAEAYYTSAIDQLEYLWLLDKENCQLMMGWVAAMHNLSSLYEKQGKSKAALKPLMQAYKTVMALLNTTSLSEGFHFSVMRAARTTLIPLLDFSKRFPICDCCKASLEASWQKLQTSQYLLH
ncbi:MAG: tetratricopeptide repeat protein [Oleispira sp.]|nr:tetratricopeptide repeat protein [Oleispira sp.]